MLQKMEAEFDGIRELTLESRAPATGAGRLELWDYLDGHRDIPG
jgi:hypothetical protein